MIDGGGEDGDGAGLVCEAKLDRHGEQQSPNAERRLQQGEQRERHRTTDERRRRFFQPSQAS